MTTNSVRYFLVALALTATAASCASIKKQGGDGSGNGGPGSGSGGSGGSTSNTGSGGGAVNNNGGSGGGGVVDNQPATCAQAASAHSYVGCEFWPTITANPVWTEFDPAVIIANGGTADAAVTIDGPASFHKQVTVGPGKLETVLLAWMMDLKGPEFSLANTSGGRLTSSMRANGGAYHVVSSAPVTAWQFNPLQYTKMMCPENPGSDGCLSASVDASILLPATAMTGNYRVFAYASKNEGSDWGSVPGGMAITATADNTTVKVQLGPKCGVEIFPTTDLGTCIAASITGDIPALNPMQIYTVQMNAGDVVQLVGAWAQYPQTRNADISGSVINADHPVQVIAFNAIAQLPDYSVANADHMEETVLPSEVLGKTYIVVPPTTPLGNAVGHVVRIYGNVDGTHLTYPEGKPADAPDTLNAGDVVQIPALPTGQPAPECVSTADHCTMNQPFIVTGDQPFAVASFMVGGTLQMPGTDATNSQGDPSMTMEVTPQQFRKQYTFLAPADYLENFADILVPRGATVVLDGAPLTDVPTPIGGGDWGFLRAKLSARNGGVHTLTTTHDSGLGLQVAGFGFATSYYYPGGLNLNLISKPPVIIP
ncbi:MAG TPA: IgGFc-binding protein [Polyangia bacterium]|jgi:hypothetical protein|nr:IgGFc-binding protein [Polyangia bacterium]